jgi:outer membrane protein assembly factor BamB
MNRRHLWLTALLLSAPIALAGDWPQWGHDNSRNMVSADARDLPETLEPGKAPEGKEQIDLSTTRNVKWVARLGNAAYGNATVSGGKVFVGTNNDAPRNPARTGDFGVLMCFDEATGKFLWQLTVPKLPAGKAADFDQVGLCSSPTVEGDRVYIVTNRCEVLCLTTDGLARKNEGPFTDEANYVGGEVGPTDADIVWRYDMRDELGVFPHNMTSSSVLILGDRLYVTTSNGTDWTNKHLPAPGAPALICLDKKTGKLLGEERSGISSRTLKCNWSSPASGKVADKDLIIFGGGDGFCYAFDPAPTADGALKEIWRCDCNPPGRRADDQGKPRKYGTDKGPSEIIATPVFVNGRVYVAIGQDPESGEGSGALTCIDAAQTGDITAKGKLWTYDKINRSISTASIADGLLYIADYSGIIHCLDAASGEPLWTHDTEGKIWASTLLADGKLYVGNEPGILTVLAAGKEKKVLAQVAFDGAIYGSALVANGVLYLGTDRYLYAVQKK